VTVHARGILVAAASIVSQVVATTKKCISGHQHTLQGERSHHALIQDAKHNLKLGRMSGRRGVEGLEEVTKEGPNH
jgi:hypothetical protein